jgi:positive phototaxis protein PixI
MLSISQANSVSLSLGTPNNQTSTQGQVRKFLQFQLGESDHALLEAELVTEIIIVPKKEVLPVPQMIYSILGVYSWRSEMLWLLDLENLLGYPPPLSASTSDAGNLLVMVVQYQGQSLGLVVPKVDSIVQQNTEEFKSASSELFPEDLINFLCGYFTDNNNNIVMLIDAEEIFNFFSL